MYSWPTMTESHGGGTSESFLLLLMSLAATS